MAVRPVGARFQGAFLAVLVVACTKRESAQPQPAALPPTAETQATATAPSPSALPASVASGLLVPSTPQSAEAGPSASRVLAGAHEIGAVTAALVREWNSATNAHDIDRVAALYAPDLELYGKRVSREEAKAMKTRAFVGHQRDEVSDVSVSEAGRATFHKRSLLKNGKTIDVVAYLDVEDGRIVAEGDTTTDENLARAKEDGCSHAVTALVDHTIEAAKAARDINDGAKKMGVPVTAGGLTFPPRDPGEPWSVGVCENHLDRMPCYMYFNVDPATAEVTTDWDGRGMRRVATDRKLAAAVRATCK